MPESAGAASIEKAFEVEGSAAGLEALGATDVTESDKITLKAPDIAENGAVVPVAVQSSLDNVEMIAVENLLDGLDLRLYQLALTGAYEIPPGMPADVTMRVKMGQSSDVIALVKADGKYYMTKKEVKVTLGGCGG